MVLRADEYERVMLPVLVRHCQILRHLHVAVLHGVGYAEHPLLLQAQLGDLIAYHDGRGDQLVHVDYVLEKVH